MRVLLSDLGHYLIGRVQTLMVFVMVARSFGRQIATLIVALVMVLNGAAPAGAMPAAIGGDTMPSVTIMIPGTATNGNCLESISKSAPAKQVPCKSDGSCPLCVSCAVNVGLVSDPVPTPFSYHRDPGFIGIDVNSDSIAVPPALPPPISRV